MSDTSHKLKAALPALELRFGPERMERVGRSLERRRRRRNALRAGGMTLLLLLAGAGLFRWQRPTTLRLADGATATPLSRDTAVEVRQASAGQLVVALVRGGARFDIAGHPFRLEAGNVAIEVESSRFVVERAAEQVWITVERGPIRVLEGAQESLLTAGAHVAFPLGGRHEVPSASRTFAPPPPSAPPPVAEEPAAPPTVTRRVAPAKPSHRTAAAPAWRAPAEQGDFDTAYQELSRSGPRSVRDVPNELLLAADVTRLSHHPAEAVPLLERLVRDHAGDPRSPLAAFTLGRVLLEELGRPQQAADAFARSRALAPSGPLSSDALAREVEAWSRAGDPTRARARAEEYLRRYPKGARISSVRRFGGLE
jgi:transmembrane sensor